MSALIPISSWEYSDAVEFFLGETASVLRDRWLWKIFWTVVCFISFGSAALGGIVSFVLGWYFPGSSPERDRPEPERELD